MVLYQDVPLVVSILDLRVQMPASVLPFLSILSPPFVAFEVIHLLEDELKLLLLFIAAEIHLLLHVLQLHKDTLHALGELLLEVLILFLELALETLDRFILLVEGCLHLVELVLMPGVGGVLGVVAIGTLPPPVVHQLLPFQVVILILSP